MTQPRTSAPKSPKLPWSALVALAVAAFITMLTETVPAGLLPQIGDGLDVSQATAGQLVTVYAAGSMLAAIPLTALTRSRPRRPVLIATILVVALVNALTALSPFFALTFAGRLIAGLGAGLQWAMLAGYAMRLVPEASKGRALAVSMSGVPIALALGVPLGTALGTGVGWRTTFAAMAGAGLLIALWIRVGVPAVSGEAAHERIALRRVLTRPGLPVVLLMAFAFEVGHMNLYTYIASFLDSSGLQQRVDAVLFLFGIAAIAGLWLTGLFIDRHLRAVVLAAFATFAASMALLATAGSHPGVALPAVAAWGLALGAAPTMLQTASARLAGPAVEVAQSMLVTMLNAGMTAGPLLGGALYAATGTRALAWTSLGIFLAVLLTATTTARRALPRTHVGAGEPAPAQDPVTASAAR
ncbi:MFS transporter [Streptomyces sp. H39-C1]|uniref:MFS transporter n=1 Tax=Streptomyces sp. H39-C1 TaxID=3004355 RepID=UPI0022AF0068|nr:MFS transporter [Streptomyces sp. H39-C1]MCZ4101056.1 MFS transporter [Streptomyces sp. H39-C1]